MQIQRLRRKIYSLILRRFEIELSLYTCQQGDHFRQIDSPIWVFLKAESHQIEQLLVKTLPFLLLSEHIDVSVIETLEHLAEDHTVHVYSQKVDIRFLLHVIQLFSCVCLQLLILLSHQHHNFVGSGIFSIDSIFDVTVVRVVFDKGSIKICKFDLFVVEENVLRT